jgi:hypothetical protein
LTRGHLQAEAGLPDAGRARQGEQADLRLGEQIRQRLFFPFASDERRQQRGEVRLAPAGNLPGLNPTLLSPTAK